jgi:hypothetical protein
MYRETHQRILKISFSSLDWPLAYM